MKENYEIQVRKDRFIAINTDTGEVFNANGYGYKSKQAMWRAITYIEKQSDPKYIKELNEYNTIKNEYKKEFKNIRNEYDSMLWYNLKDGNEYTANELFKQLLEYIKEKYPSLYELLIPYKTLFKSDLSH